MYSAEALKKEIEGQLEAIKLKQQPDKLYNPISYTLGLGGKRLRPVYTLMACNLFSDDINEALYPAIAIELFHNFTLIHDDIMDKAALRRGKETVYRKWNQDVAILSGDTMFAIAYKYMMKTEGDNLKEICDAFNKAAIDVCEGQQYDMDYEQEENVNIEDYIKMIRLKTAALIAASMKIGALAGKASKAQADLMYEYGENIGIGFQIMDDYLDVYSDNLKFGKTACGDIEANKKTYLYLKACELAKGETKDKLKYYYSAECRDMLKKVEGVKNIYSELDLQTHTLDEIEKYFLQANRILENIEQPEDRKKTIRNFTRDLMAREY